MVVILAVLVVLVGTAGSIAAALHRHCRDDVGTSVRSFAAFRSTLAETETPERTPPIS